MVHRNYFVVTINYMKHVVIVHGFRGKPESNWKPWLKNELKNKGFAVDIPKMPNPDRPDADEWVDKLAETVADANTETYLVGHSLGCITILRYLENLEDGQKIGGCVFVAGFGEKFKKYSGGHDSFFDHDLDWSKIKSHCNTFVAIHSDDDPNVEIDQLELFKNNLDAKVMPMTGMGHFGSPDGVYEAPIIRDELLLLQP
jgi:predicted alpha/beta hydrolase family esterase